MLSSADSQAALAEEEAAAELWPAEVAREARCGVGKKEGVKWYISTAFRRTSSFFRFSRLLCLERASLAEDEEDAIGFTDEEAAPLRETSAELLQEKARVAPRCRFRIGADMMCEADRKSQSMVRVMVVIGSDKSRRLMMSSE